MDRQGDFERMPQADRLKKIALSFCLYLVLRSEPRTLYMLSLHSASELYPSSKIVLSKSYFPCVEPGLLCFEELCSRSLLLFPIAGIC